VIQATARLLQLSERLSDGQVEELVREATAAGDVVILVEIDPREGSGVIPKTGRRSSDLPRMTVVSCLGKAFLI